MKRLLFLLAAPVFAYVIFVFSGLPARAEVRALGDRNPGVTSVMRQREQEARLKGRSVRSQRSWVSLGRVSKHLIHAVVTAEDARFFGHEGVDWAAIKESAETDLKRGRFARGGSTITQQLARNLFLSTHKNLTRKLRELLVARWLEDDLGKRRILELYLNVIEWGPDLYGCEAAAQRYYRKPAAELSEEEAAGLAAMIPSPRRLNPLVSPTRHARAQRRVLWLMARAGYLKKEAGALGAEPEPVVDDDGP